MKNQYFGDFGDYQKFSLLKVLRDIGNFKITVHWMKTKDDGSSDGKRVQYLNNHELWDKFDKEIFEFLKENIHANKRDLDIYEKSHHAKNLRFVNDHIEESSKRTLLLESLTKDKFSDIVFFDPDNGIEVKSTNSKNKYKYVLWDDIKLVFDSGKSVLVYQHFSRSNRDQFIKEKLAEFAKRFKNKVFVIRVKHSVYFLIAQEKHSNKLETALHVYSKIWGQLVIKS